jgi:hypothetical protein
MTIEVAEPIRQPLAGFQEVSGRTADRRQALQEQVGDQIVSNSGTRIRTEDTRLMKLNESAVPST